MCEKMDKITFKINGVGYQVGCELSSDLSLVDFIREYAELRGTKYMCREGGCGACIVSVLKGPNQLPEAVNSCLVSVLSCQDWEITTVEKVGNRMEGYDPLQKTLAQYHGSQCGHCSPGWIMAMYSLLKKKPDLTMLEIEKSFGSNVCRCTGYRPILEAWKTFASDAPNRIQLPDIEDLDICKKDGRNCKKKDSCDLSEWCLLIGSKKVISLKDGKTWYQVHSIADIFSIWLKEETNSSMLVAGNTAKGAYPINEYPQTLIDVSNVTELKGHMLDQNLVIGAGNTLSELLDILQQAAKEEYFKYLQKLYDHINLVAHIAVRNIGTIAGNLMIKHQHNEFPSDIFLLFETVGAQLTIVSNGNMKQTVTLDQFLTLDMKRRIILEVLLPPLNETYHLVTYKIMPKAQNAHAIVNAGFLYKLDSFNRVSEARLAYGGLSPAFNRATQTELLLLQKDLFTNDTLQKAIESLKTELIVTQLLPETSVAYRKQLAINLFYKSLLSICPSSILHSKYLSGASKIKESRPVSQGRQIYNTNASLYPLNQPVEKLEALIQCSGEALYTEDIPSLPREVFAAFVLSTVAKGTIVDIDPSMALDQPGVIAVYTAKDIPGVNSFMPKDAASIVLKENEELLCGGEVKFYNQPIGIVVAETKSIANRVAKSVKVLYDTSTINTKPVLDINDAINDPNRKLALSSSEATDKGTDVVKVIKGANTIRGQYHMTLETLVCVTKPIEEGLEVHSATQYMDAVQTMTARLLEIDQNRVDVHVRRLGGAFGLKVSRILQPTMACNLVAYKLNRPCRFIQSLTDNMKTVGMRYSCTTNFEVGVDLSGVIQYNNYTLYEDDGYMVNEPLAFYAVNLFNNAYKKSRWNYTSFDILTDTAKNSFIRAPGSLENITMAEFLMEQIAYEINRDPLEVRLANLDDSEYGDLRTMATTLRTNAQYDTRRLEVDKYNNENRWKKRGLRFSFTRWSMGGAGCSLEINLSACHDDGSVTISHGGIEMGQGVNTKAAQVAAYLLKIPLDKIKVKPTNTIIAPNSFVSGNSRTSQNVLIGVRKACEQLLDRLDPVRTQLGSPTWEELVKTAFNMGVDLQAHGFTNNADEQTYNTFGVGLAEVEVDILTGEFEVLRADLMQDVGQSVSPGIDVGQVEGAFLMGVGYFTSEQPIYNPQTGELLSDRTWNYYVPQARDIPQDLRVYFRESTSSPEIIFGSKAISELPICLSTCVPLAIIEALAAARLDSGIPTTTWYGIDGPYTVEKIGLSTAIKSEDFKFN